MSVSTMAGADGRSLLSPVAVLLLLLGVEVGEVGAGALEVREAAEAGQAVPVIHLNSGKASVDEYLKLFPEQLLGSNSPNVSNSFCDIALLSRVFISASNKRVKPIDVRKIEHEDFIDYEIEFIELPNDEADTNEFISKKTPVSESSQSRAETNRIQDDSFSFDRSGVKIGRGGDNPGEVNLVNFVDLFRRARTKHRSRGRGREADRPGDRGDIRSDRGDRGDIRRRRRIKLKRDPGARSQHQREINDSRNQIDTSEQSKREQNNFRSWVSKELMIT